DPKLEVIPLRKDMMVLICHPQHAFAKSKSIRLKDIEGQKFIGFEPDIPTRRAIDKILKEQGVEVQHVMEFDNIETVKRAAESDAEFPSCLTAPSPRKLPSKLWPKFGSKTLSSSGPWLPSTRRTRC